MLFHKNSKFTYCIGTIRISFIQEWIERSNYLPTFVLSLQERIKLLREVLTKDNPSFLSEVTKPEGIDEAKAAKIALTGYKCNTSGLTKDLSNYGLGGKCHDVNFHNHLQNTYLCTAVDKALSKFLTEELKASLSEIYPILRVSCLWLAFARTYDKELSLAVKYPKGHY